MPRNDQLFKPEQKIEVVGYDISVAYVPPGGEPIDLRQYCVTISVTNEYEINMFPILSVKLNCPDPVVRSIRESYHQGRVTMEVKKAGLNENTEYSPMGDTFIPNSVFKIMDVEFRSTDDEYRPEDNDKGDSTGVVERKEIILDLFMVEHLEMTKKLISKVYKDNTLEFAAGAIFTKLAKIPVMMAKPDNNKTYEHIMIPPQNLKASIYYIQEFYGFYKNGIRFFFDYNWIYLLDRIKGIGKDIGKRYHRVHVEVFSKRTIDPNDQDGWNTKEDGQHELKTGGATNTIESDLSSRHIEGDSLKVGRYQNDTKHSIGSDQYRAQADDYTPKQRYIWNSTSNPFLQEEFTGQRKEIDFNITQAFHNIPADRITPDRDFHFQFRGDSKKKYESKDGKYRLKSAVFVFYRRKSGSKVFDVEVQGTFVKVR